MIQQLRYGKSVKPNQNHYTFTNGDYHLLDNKCFLGIFYDYFIS